jgi:hypothetical protein
MEKKKMYNDTIIQVAGGLNDYIGKLDQAPHPMGEGWYRIKEPCMVFTREDPKSRSIQNVIMPLKGRPGDENYRNYVDIRIPDTMPMEIRTLQIDGPMYKIYIQEMNRKKSNIIIPDNSIVAH